MIPLRTTLALLLFIAAVLLVAGCIGGDYIMEQDVVLVRLTSDGNTAWTRTIDSGSDDMISDLLQTPEGTFILAGGQSEAQCNSRSHRPTIPTLHWVSVSGEIVNQKTYGNGTPDGFVVLSPTVDGNYRAITRNGDVLLIDRAGTVINAIDPGQVQNLSARQSGLYTCRDPVSCTQTRDGGYVSVEGAPETRGSTNTPWTRYHAVKIDNNGTVAWGRDVISFQIIGGFGKSSLKKIIQTDDGGFLLAFENENKLIPC
jgi:hypothetical protein